MDALVELVVATESPDADVMGNGQRCTTAGGEPKRGIGDGAIRRQAGENSRLEGSPKVEVTDGEIDTRTDLCAEHPGGIVVEDTRAIDVREPDDLDAAHHADEIVQHVR